MMLGIESPVRELSENSKKCYQEQIKEYIKNGIDFGNYLDGIYQEGWYDGYEDCLSEGYDNEEEW